MRRNKRGATDSGRRNNSCALLQLLYGECMQRLIRIYARNEDVKINEKMQSISDDTARAMITVATFVDFVY